jgi:tetratricopeptide (TPR) repeat protein
MKRYITIILLLITTLAAFPQLNTNHYYYVGKSRLKYFKNYTGAIENFNIVIKLKPHMPQPYFFRGQAKKQLEDYRGAIRDYNKALEIKPFYIDAYRERGIANHLLKNYEEALLDYNRVLEMDQENGRIYFLIGFTKIKLNDIEGSIDNYNKALDINPNLAYIYLERSYAKKIKGDLDGAIGDCNMAIKLRPHLAGAYLIRGMTKYDRDDYTEALKDFDISIRLDSKIPYAFFHRALVKQQLEDYKGAIMDYDMAIKLKPTMAEAWFNRGIAKEMTGIGEYIHDFKTAGELDAEYENFNLRLEEEKRKRQQRYYAQSQTNNTKSGKNKKSTTKSSGNTIKKGSNKKKTPISNKRRRKRIMINEEGNISETYVTEITDGKIQNKRVKIELQPDFTITMFHKDSVDYDKLQYYSMEIDALNRKNNNNPFLVISNKKNNLSQWKVEEYSKKIAWQNEFINNNKKLSRGYFNRAVYYDLRNDYNKSIVDFDKAIKSDERAIMKYFSNGSTPSNTKRQNAFTTTLLSYFGRAVTRMKMADYIQSLSTLPEPSTLTIKGVATQEEEEDKDGTIMDYSEILDDYEKVIFMNPRFIFGWFNMANVKVKQRNYIGAIEDYSKAIEIENDYAEAYYNRGLTRIFLDDLEGGAIDLSKAGELGIEEAYNVIKRYCN